jgi:hypothetical protein
MRKNAEKKVLSVVICLNSRSRLLKPDKNKNMTMKSGN